MERKAIGVDIGGTKISAGRIADAEVEAKSRVHVPVEGSMEEVLSALYSTIDEVYEPDIAGIGVGAPSVVDIEQGIVYDVQNIPSWKKVPLKQLLESRYNVPVVINNDANCFAIGEYTFGKGRNYSNTIGLIIGTGMAAGVIINDSLYAGKNCGAGEFGMVPYLDQNYEYYCSGQFFENVHNISGVEAYRMAVDGDARTLAMYTELGAHIGAAIQMILYTYDPEIIVLGGSVAKAYPYFKKGMWDKINQLAYSSVLGNLKIEFSKMKDVALLGAAALYYKSTT